MHVESTTIYPSQIKGLFRSLKGKIFRIALFVFVTFFLILILKSPPVYIAEATFKQSQSRNDDFMHLQSFLQNVVIQQNDSDAITLMHSKKLLYRVVQEMGLQMAVSDRGLMASLFSKLVRNLSAEFNIFVEDRESFKFRNVICDNERPLSFYLKFLSSERFEILDEKKQFLAQGALNENMLLSDYAFILSHVPSSISLKKLYLVRIIPWHKVVEGLQKTITLKPGRSDKSLICLSCRGFSRKHTAALLNCLMSQFQTYLRQEHEEIAGAQLAYLAQRQNYLSEEFNQALQNHAHYLAQNLGKNGFIGIAQEIEMLAIPKENYTSKLFDLDLELKRWQYLESGRLEFAAQNKPDGQEVMGQKKLASLELLEQGLLAAEPINESANLHHLEAQFLGLDLESLQELYSQYGQEKDNLQSDVDQLAYIHKQMELPHFELSSLSNLLKDPVSIEMIAKASRLSLELHDENNRMPKEQERLKEALLTQKSFLSEHLAQSIELFKIKLRHLEDKMAFLQNKATTLIKNEKKLLHSKLADLHLQMKDFPEKWHLENQLKLKKDLTMKMIEGMTKLTESKVVHHHLFQIESKPLDKAIPPLLPKSPYLFFFSIVCGILAGMVYFLFHLIKKMVQGFPVCPEWLQESNHHFSGTIAASVATSLKEIKKQDLETLRNCASFITMNKKKVIPVIGNSSCADLLAELLALQTLKTILVQATFHSSQEPSGLLQYLTEDNEHLAFSQKEHYDFLPSGGYTPFGAELLNSSKFSALLDQLKERYDCILITSSAKSNSLEVECLVKHADGLIIMLDQEIPYEIKRFIEWEKKRNERSLSFVLTG